MSLFVDMERLRPDIYLTDEQKNAMRAALRPPSFADQLKMLSVDELIVFLRNQAIQMRSESSLYCENIQPVDMDRLAEVFDVIAYRLETIAKREKIPL